MTDIDLEADIRISINDGSVTATLPLAGPVTPQWQRRYDELAKAQDIPALCRQRDDTAWIMVTVSMPDDRAGIEATMDAARHLVTKIRADAEAAAAAAAESILREWWTRQRSDART
jgi:hypothetical protein